MKGRELKYRKINDGLGPERAGSSTRGRSPLVARVAHPENALNAQSNSRARKVNLWPGNCFLSLTISKRIQPPVGLGYSILSHGWFPETPLPVWLHLSRWHFSSVLRCPTSSAAIHRSCSKSGAKIRLYPKGDGRSSKYFGHPRDKEVYLAN